MLEGHLVHLQFCHIYRLLVEVVLLTFFDPDGADLRLGMLFDLKQHGPLVVAASVDIIIADTKALVEAVGALGYNAVLPCFLCRKIVSYNAKEKPMLKENDSFVTLA